MKSSRELDIDIKLIDKVDALNLSVNAMKCLKIMLANEEIQASQEYANTVSIVRLGYNDHGPVHMRTVTYNSVLMLELLKKAGIKTSLEQDGCGDYEDSLIAVMIASMFHDLGMGMGRQNHELHSTILALPLIDKILEQLYQDNIRKRVMIRATALEGIAGHMGTINISSIEAGIIQIADGCDMTKGRARIPIALASSHRLGHIHQYSANSIEGVTIQAGKEKPIRIDVNMSNEVGLFQVEEVLLHKIAQSTATQFIELYAKVRDDEPKKYL
ncbi:MAG: phosphohydrolase [Treponema sp.]|jgi:metal-dependent HD superfamily phosphatase/phosphodiesterase|nr:phosphohydrolase [Treponema sp.]